MARFTALQRVRLKRNIYQTSSSSTMRGAFTPGETGFISRVPPNNQHVQHDDNCIYCLMLDSGFTQGTGAYPMDEAGWMVLAIEIEDIDEQARLEAVAAEMRQISDEYWDAGQPTATLTSTPRPTVAPPVRSVPNCQGVQITGAWLDEQSDRVDHVQDAAAYMPTSWHSENPFE